MIAVNVIDCIGEWSPAVWYSFSDLYELSVCSVCCMGDGVFQTIDASPFSGDNTAHVMKSRIFLTCNESTFPIFDAVKQCSLGMLSTIVVRCLVNGCCFCCDEVMSARLLVAPCKVLLTSPNSPPHRSGNVHSSIVLSSVLLQRVLMSIWCIIIVQLLSVLRL